MRSLIIVFTHSVPFVSETLFTDARVSVKHWLDAILSAARLVCTAQVCTVRPSLRKLIDSVHFAKVLLFVYSN